MNPVHDLNDLRTQIITCIALNCIPILPLLGLCILTTRQLIKTRHEPRPSKTRVAFIVCCVALYLELLCQLTFVPIYATTLPTTTPSTPPGDTIRLLKIGSYVSDAANLLYLLSQSALFASLSFLSKKSKSPSWDAALSLTCLAFAITVATLALAGLGKEVRYVHVFWERWMERQDLEWINGVGHNMKVETMKVVGAVDVVIWVGVVGVAVFAARVGWRVREKGGKGRKMTIIKYLVAACLVWLLPATWRLAYQLCWLLRDDYDSRVCRFILST